MAGRIHYFVPLESEFVYIHYYIIYREEFCIKRERGACSFGLKGIIFEHFVLYLNIYH